MPERERRVDIAIVGAGLGGIAAALAAARLGKTVLLSEETDWIGGQLTAQAVPPDEHPWIETLGCPPSYRRLRDGIRAHYRRHYPLLPGPRADPRLNPGQGWVSHLCHEPRVAVGVLESMLAPHRATGLIDLRLNHRLIAAALDGDVVRTITLHDDRSGDALIVHAAHFLDATELGDLLPLTGAEHVVGAEGQDETGEPHALPGPPQPLDQQAVSWCFALDHLPGEDHAIPRPASYDFWRTYRAPFQAAPHFGWDDLDPETHEGRHLPLFRGPSAASDALDLWSYRRIFYRGHYPPARFPSDITIVNWSQNDYWLGPLLGVPDSDRQRHLAAARDLSRSLLFWMQTEAPRHDRGYGYPGLRLRPDVVGTVDGLAKHVYVREGRRIRAVFTVREQHVGVAARTPHVGAAPFPDSVGIGSYRIDLHPSATLRPSVDVATYPFQIPLGALIPVRLDNLLPANKNIGTTHITNGCYRLHPVEWTIGEAAGALATFALDHQLPPRHVHATPALLASFQHLLTQTFGSSLAWPEEIRPISR